MSTTTQKEFFIQLALNSWNTQNKRVSQLLASLNDKELMEETAPGRNRGIYLLGHLVATSDAMLPLLGLGERLYPHLDSTFVTKPDKASHEFPSLTELREYWSTVTAALTKKFESLSSDDWFAKHNAVSSEDFAKEPHRNKLNVLLSRTNHTSYHLGQLVYLKRQNEEN